MISHRIPASYQFWRKQSDTEKTVVYWSTRPFAGKLFVYFFLNQFVLRRYFWAYICIFYSLSGNLLPGFIARHYMILFRCLVTLIIRGNSVGRVLLIREITDNWNGKNSRIFIFLGYGSATFDLMIIQSAWLNHISNHFNSIIHCLY